MLLETTGPDSRSSHRASHELAGNGDLSLPLVKPVWERANSGGELAQPHLVALVGASRVPPAERAEDQQCRYDAETQYENGSHSDPKKLLPKARIYQKHKENQPKTEIAPVTVEVSAACLEGDNAVMIPFPPDINISTTYLGDAEINGVMQHDVNEAKAYFKDQSGKTLEFTAKGLGKTDATAKLRLFMLDIFFDSMAPTINEARRNQNAQKR